MSSGSLKQFLKKTKKNHKTMNVKVGVFTLVTNGVGVFHMMSHGGGDG